MQNLQPSGSVLAMLMLPDIRAGAITADPPLAFEAWSRKGEGRPPQHHYACLSFEQLAAMPIASVAALHCFLFLWIPLRSVFLVEPLMRAWGFVFSGVGFSWVKQNRSGVGWFMGGGYGTRHNVEICWLGRRGSPRRKSAGVRELIVAPVRDHSRKPDEIYRRVEEFCDGPYLELFSRQQWPGWTCVGDEIGKFREAPPMSP
jgi:N6-adenosine-specific RNA methylase IME4